MSNSESFIVQVDLIYFFDSNKFFTYRMSIILIRLFRIFILTPVVDSDILIYLQIRYDVLYPAFTQDALPKDKFQVVQTFSIRLGHNH